MQDHLMRRYVKNKRVCIFQGGSVLAEAHIRVFLHGVIEIGIFNVSSSSSI